MRLRGQRVGGVPRRGELFAFDPQETAGATGLNAISRRTLGWFFERALFFDARDLPVWVAYVDAVQATGARVHVRGNRIVAVGTDVEAPGAEVIDLGGRVLLPGYVDTPDKRLGFAVPGR